MWGVCIELNFKLCVLTNRPSIMVCCTLALHMVQVYGRPEKSSGSVRESLGWKNVWADLSVLRLTGTFKDFDNKSSGAVVDDILCPRIFEINLLKPLQC